MPKPAKIEDASHLLTGLSVIGNQCTDGTLIGALTIDGVTVSYSVTEGPGLTPYQELELLVVVEAVSSRFPDPWLTPAAVHLTCWDGSFQAEIYTQEADFGTPSIRQAGEQIALLASFLLAEPHRRRINILVGDESAHRDFHLWNDDICERRTSAE